MRSISISIVRCSYPGYVILPRRVAPSAKAPSSCTRNHAPNSWASVSARQTRDRGARSRMDFSIRSVLVMVGNLLVAVIQRFSDQRNLRVALVRVRVDATARLRGNARELLPLIVRHGGLRSPLAEAYAADPLLRARDQPRGHAERTEAEPEKLRHRLLAPCQLAAQRDRHAWRVGDGDRPQPQDGGMRVVVVVAHGGIVPSRSERVLREVVRANGEEVHVAGDRGDAERGGGRLDRSEERRGGTEG